ncbi:MAG: hypothetical protein HUJ94_01885 [Bacteroidales bacterium]|nr:hypothetical protein [Bacteroidales bacterium]
MKVKLPIHTLSVLILLVYGCCNSPKKDADIFSIEAPSDTLLFRQAPFEWHISPRFDYSKTLVMKLFLSDSKKLTDERGFRYADSGEQDIVIDFEQAMEIIRKTDALTPGLHKIVYLVGWQYTGHDSKYPAFFEGNETLKRPCDKDALESVRWVMSEAKKYNTTVSLHINLIDVYLDSPLYDEYVKEDVLCKDSDGELYLCKWGNKICYPAEWDKGLVQQRLDSLCRILPIAEAGTVHVDAFLSYIPGQEPGGPMSPGHNYTHEQDIEAQQKIIKYLDRKGIDVTTEFIQEGADGKAFDGYFPMYYHFGDIVHALSLSASQAACGDASPHFGDYGALLHAFGDNYPFEEVFRGHLKNHYPGDISAAMDEAFAEFKARFCTSSLICQYLNTFARTALITDKDRDRNDVIGVFGKGIRTHYKDGNMRVAKDGNILADGSDVFIPAVWLGNGSIIAYSGKGCIGKSWTIPAGVKLSRNVKAWTLTPDGRKEFTYFEIKGRQLTLSLAPGQMVLFADK